MEDEEENAMDERLPAGCDAFASDCADCSAAVSEGQSKCQSISTACGVFQRSAYLSD